MADDDLKSIDLKAYEDGLIAAIRAAMPGLVTVEFYRDDQTEEVPTPACILEMADTDFEPDEDPGTGQVKACMSMRARLLFSKEEAPADHEIRVAGMVLAAAIFNSKRPGGACGPARPLWAGPDAFHPGNGTWAVWAVEWRQDAYVGGNVWANDDGVIPSRLFYGFAPDIGPSHVDDYIEVTK